MTNNVLTRNEHITGLLSQAIDAWREGNKAKASAFRAKININLRRNGEDPEQFWADFQKAAQIFAAKA